MKKRRLTSGWEPKVSGAPAGQKWTRQAHPSIYHAQTPGRVGAACNQEEKNGGQWTKDESLPTKGEIK